MPFGLQVAPDKSSIVGEKGPYSPLLQIKTSSRNMSEFQFPSYVSSNCITSVDNLPKCMMKGPH